MKRLVVLELSEFGRGVLEEQAGRENVAVAAVVREAALYYAADLRLARPAATPPPPIRADGAGRLARLQLEADLDTTTWSMLESVAKRQSVSLERVLIHAVLYYVADMESGRLPRRLTCERGEGDP